MSWSLPPCVLRRFAISSRLTEREESLLLFRLSTTPRIVSCVDGPIAPSLTRPSRNEQHRIFTVDHFLTEAEIEHVLRVARERITAEHDGDESWQYWKRYAFTEMDDWQGDAVLRSIEERIAQLVNIRTHGDESPLIVSQTLPQKAKDRPRRGKRCERKQRQQGCGVTTQTAQRRMGCPGGDGWHSGEESRLSVRTGQ